jgi:hypothetical protein
MRKNFHDIQALIRFIVARFAQDRCAQTAAQFDLYHAVGAGSDANHRVDGVFGFPGIQDFSIQIKIYLMNNLMPENILEDLASADMVRKAEGNGWLLVRDMGHIRATELLHLFVLDRGLLPAKQIDDPLQQWLAACAERLEQSTDITLQELFARRSAWMLARCD